MNTPTSLVYYPNPEAAPILEGMEEGEVVVVSTIPLKKGGYRIHLVRKKEEHNRYSNLKFSAKKSSAKNKFAPPAPPFLRPLMSRPQYEYSAVFINQIRYSVKEVTTPNEDEWGLEGKERLKQFNFYDFNVVLEKSEFQKLLNALLCDTKAKIPVPEYIPVTANPRPMLQKIRRDLVSDFEKSLITEGEVDQTKVHLDEHSQQRFHRYMAPIVSICEFYWNNKWNEDLVSENEDTFTIKLPKGVSSLRGKSLVGKAASQVKKDLDELGGTRFTLVMPIHYDKKKGKKKGWIEYLVKKFVLVTASYEAIGERNGKPYHRLVKLECKKSMIQLVQRDYEQKVQTGYRMIPNIYDLLEKYPKQKYDYHYLFVGWCFSAPRFERDTRNYRKLLRDWGIENKKNPKREPERFEELIAFGKELGLLVDAQRKGDTVELQFSPDLIPRVKAPLELENKPQKTENKPQKPQLVKHNMG